MRLFFHPLGLRPLIANWEVAAQTILARLHREQAATPSEGLKSLLAQLREDPSIPLRWHHPDPAGSLAPVLPLEIAAAGQKLKLFSMISTFGTPQDVTTDELRVETFFPADSASNLLMQCFADAGSTGTK